MKKICVITGTRADYGLLRWVMQGIKDDPDLKLQIIVTGMHLSPEFGNTYKAIEEDGFTIDQSIEMIVSSDTPVGIAKSMGLGLIGFADAFNILKPDLIVILGDRFEIFSAASAALVARIPAAHIHGGETTEGAFDESLRHSITKMSHLHFVASEVYKNRVIQLGEQPDKVFLVGGLGIDNIKQLQLLNKEALEKSLNLQFWGKNLLITFHPVTLDTTSSEEQMNELLCALEMLYDTQLIFTLPNADTEGRTLIKMVNDFSNKHKNAHVFTSLGQLKYLSCIAQVDGVIGNSSSGLTEAPSMLKGTINIGNRQNGRLQSSSIINCKPTRHDISEALLELYSTEFKSKLPQTRSPYGEEGASNKILKLLKSHIEKNLIIKSFYDLPIK